MALPAEPLQYTYEDYLNWEADDRIELIDGEPIMMSPPTRLHQEVSGSIFAQLHNFLEGKRCKVFHAPFGVRLFEEAEDYPEDVDTVVEPDISVVCDLNKLDQMGCRGAPDMVIEILSPSTQRHDRLVKLNLYQRAGVREYWIVDPQGQSVEVYLPDSGGSLRVHEVYGRKDIAKVNSLNGCFIELRKVFEE